jgi:protoporphyrinogen oxidase
VTGLTVAYRLIASGVPGRKITILEARPYLGGLASSFQMNSVRVDRYYHFICKQDDHYLRLLGELGLAGRVTWRPSKMAFYDQGRLLGFSSAFDLVRFPGIGVPAKLRYAALVAAVRFSKNWCQLENITARDWLERWLGKAGHEFFWQELIRRKFGGYSEELSAAWVWARIKRNATSRRGFRSDYVAYLNGGTQAFLDVIAARLTEAGVQLKCETPVSRILIAANGRVEGAVTSNESRVPASIVVHTAPLTTLAAKCEGLASTAYAANLARMKNIGLVCTVLELDRPLSGFFWTNVTDKEAPQTGVIEFTALAPDYHEKGKTIIYLPEYRELTQEERSKIDEPRVIESYYALLSKLNARFEPQWITGGRVFSELHAQPICPVGFTSMVPDADTGIRGLWAVDHSQLLPDDRTISGCIGIAGGLATRLRSSPELAG